VLQLGVTAKIWQRLGVVLPTITNPQLILLPGCNTQVCSILVIDRRKKRTRSVGELAISVVSNLVRLLVYPIDKFEMCFSNEDCMNKGRRCKFYHWNFGGRG
jgi:hypothetical protein